MEGDGLVSSEEVARGTHGRKRQYQVTAAGLEEFRRWVNEDIEHPRVRDAFKLKTAYTSGLALMRRSGSCERISSTSSSGPNSGSR